MRPRSEPEPLVLTSEDVRSGRARVDARGRVSAPPRAPEPLALAAQDALQAERVWGGKDAEELVAAHHDLCLAADVAYVHKVPTPYVVVGRRGPVFHGKYSKKAGCDYRGAYLDGSRTPHGRALQVHAECKSDADPHGAIYLRELRDVQRDALDAAEAAGHCALVLCVFGRGPRRVFYAVPWWEVRMLEDAGHRALRGELLTGWGVRAGEAYLARFSTAKGAR